MVILYLLIIKVFSDQSCQQRAYQTSCKCSKYYSHGIVTCTNLTGQMYKKLFRGLSWLEQDNDHFVLTGDACDQLLAGTYRRISLRQVVYIKIKDAPNFKFIDTNVFCLHIPW